MCASETSCGGVEGPLELRHALLGLGATRLVALGLARRLPEQEVDLVQLALERLLVALQIVGQSGQLLVHRCPLVNRSSSQSSGIRIQPCFMA